MLKFSQYLRQSTIAHFVEGAICLTLILKSAPARCEFTTYFDDKLILYFQFNFSDEEEDELEEASEDEAPPVVAKPTKKAMKKGKQKT